MMETWSRFAVKRRRRCHYKHRILKRRVRRGGAEHAEEELLLLRGFIFVRGLSGSLLDSVGTICSACSAPPLRALRFKNKLKPPPIHPLLDPALIDQNVRPSIHKQKLGLSTPRASRQ